MDQAKQPRQPSAPVAGASTDATRGLPPGLPDVLEPWAERCRARGLATGPGAGADALLATLATALAQGGQTAQLGRSARSWGARAQSPADVVTALAALRTLLGEDPRSLVALGVPSAPAGLSPAVLHELLDQVMFQAVDAAAGQLSAIARTDPLTGCRNRRALAEDLRRALAAAEEADLDLAVAAIDLDGLKTINDTRGHAAGDAALSALVATFRRELRDADDLYRTGGDEFVLLLPFTDAAGARALLGRLERAGGPAFSWGVAARPRSPGSAPLTPDALVHLADLDLYRRRRERRRRRARQARFRRGLGAASAVASLAAAVTAFDVAQASSPPVPASVGARPVGAGPVGTASAGSAREATRRTGTPGANSSTSSSGTLAAHQLGSADQAPANLLSALQRASMPAGQLATGVFTSAAPNGPSHRGPGKPGASPSGPGPVGTRPPGLGSGHPSPPAGPLGLTPAGPPGRQGGPRHARLHPPRPGVGAPGPQQGRPPQGAAPPAQPVPPTPGTAPGRPLGPPGVLRRGAGVLAAEARVGPLDRVP
ncbi:diguanylate cyclase [Aciditerrimonas ferrireducens]|nr:diguanylate cyclase [Aciditerrimonas ferrireducens]